ncbi:MAG TPA: 16S rRNA (cytidine(1402)-2'-O)-methyltransferase [Gammaproteobacteria bacterium]|nr:16S rRNA (cytidine(1402)-2'-O)-methyltransferase [Gammaproteobacteria bacterium]
MEPRTLYVVATPIGNLADLSPRAQEVLAGVDRIAAEDTRHSARLLRHFGITTPATAFHEHNEQRALEDLLRRLEAGEAVALISDAGTPLLSDPGYHLVRAVWERGLRAVPIPGPSAAVAALSVGGLPTDRVAFEGFLPAKAGARRKRLEGLRDEPRTLVFYEAPHRLAETLADLAAVFGPERRATVARELTKAHETVRPDTLEALRQWVEADSDQRRGEVVLLVEGLAAEAAASARETEGLRVAERLARELPASRAAAVAAEITGAKKNALYRHLVKGDEAGET